MPIVFFDYPTLFLYIIVGVLGAFCFKQANRKRFVVGEREVTAEIGYYCLFFFIFVLFAVLRKVAYKIGGTDAIAYKDLFENILKDAKRFAYQEQLFFYLNMIVREVTDNYKIYSVICYGVVAFSYCFFVKNISFCNESYIPFILLVFPYLKSFSSIRSSLAVAVFLIGAIYLKKRKNLLGVVLIVATFWIHRMSVLYISFLVFYMIFRKRIVNLVGYKLYLFLIGYMSLGYMLSRIVQEYVLAFQLFYSDTDRWNMARSLEYGLMSRWPMMFPFLLLLLAIFFLHKKLPNTEDMHFLKMLVFFDVIVLLPSLVLGMYRANEYFYIARLTMWGVLIDVFLRKFHSNIKPILKVGIFIGFLSWLIFRIYKEYEDLSIMPYIFDLF